MGVFFRFANPISEVYREKLQTFSDSILAKGITENRPPSIDFTGINWKTFDEIENLRDAYDRRYGA